MKNSRKIFYAIAFAALASLPFIVMAAPTNGARG
jgi:hypothetical protein